MSLPPDPEIWLPLESYAVSVTEVEVLPAAAADMLTWLTSGLNSIHCDSVQISLLHSWRATFAGDGARALDSTYNGCGCEAPRGDCPNVTPCDAYWVVSVSPSFTVGLEKLIVLSVAQAGAGAPINNTTSNTNARTTRTTRTTRTVDPRPSPRKPSSRPPRPAAFQSVASLPG